MRKSPRHRPSRTFRAVLAGLLLSAALIWGAAPAARAADVAAPVVVVSAEGLSDPNFYKDKTMAYDEALRDAKRQAIEKAVGCFVTSQTIVENYALVKDQIISKTEGAIKQIMKEVNAGVQPDGFYHVYIKAEVYAKPLEEAVGRMSKVERVALIRERGNLTFSVGIDVRSADNQNQTEECRVCATEIQNRLKNFGYKIISEDAARRQQEERVKAMVVQGFSKDVAASFIRKSSDVSLTGFVKLTKSPEVRIAGVRVRTTLLTAWALDATDNHTSEIIFSENFRPAKGTAYNDDDEAILDVGRSIGNLFSKDVFKDYVMRPSHSILLTFAGIQDRELAQMMKKELLGLRSVLNVNFKEFLSGGESVFEVEFGGSREQFANLLDGVILAAFNRKYGEKTFSIQEEHGDVVRIVVNQGKGRNITPEKMDQGIPLQLAAAVAPERLQEVVKSPELKQKVVAQNPDAAKALMNL